MAKASKGTRRPSGIPLSRQIAGRVVAGLEELPSGASVIRFEDGGSLVIRQGENGLDLLLHDRVTPSGQVGPQPTRRQREYLEFIRRYIGHYGVSPAETDIQAHFLVSAPAVHQMIRTLERRGLIIRDRDWLGRTVPRSIRVLWEG